MSILCRLGGHEADRGEVWNAGYHFSACRRCGRDMIRSGGGWEIVPAGHKVVWKKGHGRHSVAAAHSPNLPVAYAAPASTFASWNRRLIQLAGSGIGTGRAGREPQREESDQYPYFLALAAVVGAGLQMLLRSRGASPYG